MEHTVVPYYTWDKLDWDEIEALDDQYLAAHSDFNFNIDELLAHLEEEEEYDKKKSRHVVLGRDCMLSGSCKNNNHVECENKEWAMMPESPVRSTRSVLRTNRMRIRTPNPRPDTPSESEEDELPYKYTIPSARENIALTTVVSVSQVTGQIRRTTHDVKSPPPPTVSPPAIPHTDHSYHQKKNVKHVFHPIDNLGIETPSDS
ncbi:hypothetical protein L9F63_019225, partial [Diploptera punctata]